MLAEIKEKRKISVGNQTVKHYLLQWYYFDTNIESLNEAELVKMKILYASLKHLDADEQNFLAYKYRVQKDPYVKTDSVVAKELEMSLKDYKKERIRIEGKLRYPIGKYSTKFRQELSEAISLNYGK